VGQQAPELKSGLDTLKNPRYVCPMINAATFFWYFSYPLPAEATARLI